ncbi:DNA-formamidopyrimidine glycosylase [Mesomycoplasma neurolyticum]|uniref:Formamidopyrimidine-DNA glycosylase n=1 Tax=Mesomycoplasma neurolyticum TaxID=2120 RepID=A0A449A604_9BACT|nr:DNA-formamidopyrimidine glycosylase [Mesomycoplasma neurolyticum]VEU59668.1 formamidopyrimidine-DNA glycosylase [Mesomycoplasma neurolyticum]
MPELPEVVVVSRQLNKNITGKVINDVIVYNKKLIKEIDENSFKNKLIDKTILKVDNFGKFIVFHLTDNVIMLSHLRMEGKYFYYDQPNFKMKHDYIIFKFNDNSFLHYNDTRMFGTFHLRNKNSYKQIDPLNKLSLVPWKLQIDDFYNKLQRKNQKIKTALLDQTLILGLGNIYADEVLFASKISPFKKANKITKIEAENLLKNSTKILKASIKLGGSSINSYTSLNKTVGEYQNFLKVHTKANQPCVECKNFILKTKINGRGTYYCDVCQENNDI